MSEHPGITVALQPDDHLGHAERMALAAGNARSWEQAYRRLHLPLYGYCLRLCGDEQLALELAHDAFVRTMRRCRERGTPEGLRAHLFATGRNLHLHEAQRRRRGVPARRSAGDQSPPGGEVHDAIAGLPDRHRHALAMCELERSSYAAIGTVLDATESDTAHLVCDARLAFAEAVGLSLPDAFTLAEVCRDNRELISRRLDGQLRGRALHDLEDHLGTCAVCQSTEESFGQLQQRYRGFVPVFPLGVDEGWALVAERGEAEGLVQESDGFGFDMDDPVLGAAGLPRGGGWLTRRRLLIVAAALLAIGAAAAYAGYSSQGGDERPAAASTETSDKPSEDETPSTQVQTTPATAPVMPDTATPQPDPQPRAQPDPSDTTHFGEPDVVEGPANLTITALSWEGGTATVSIANEGGTASGPVSVQVSIGSSSWSSTVRELESGAADTVTLATGCQDGDFTVVATVDSGRDVKESNESDNTASSNFSSVC